MFRNYLKVAIRTLRRNRLISFINIFGLGLSMSVGMMVMIRLQDQLNYDNFHPYPERTYRVLSDYTKKTGEHWAMASTPLPLNTKLPNLTGIENSVTIYPAFNGKASYGGKELYINGAFTDQSFFTIFGFKLTSGDKLRALQRPDGIVLSKNTAYKFFGTENPAGKIITMESGKNFVVTGVMDDPPGKSHISFDAFAPMAAVPQMEKDKVLAEKSADWYSFSTAYTYVLLKKGFDAKTINSGLGGIAAILNKDNKDGVAAFSLQPVDKITPGSDHLQNNMSGGSGWGKFYFELGVSLIILLAACFNYTNLTVARALTRAKEVGIRKINGAHRSQVFVQYIVESVLLALLSLGFAWVLLSFIIHYAPFNDGYEYIPSSFHYNGELFMWSLLFALFTGLLAGTSPAWILSAFSPLRVLKNMATAKILGRVSIQKTLIVFQYSLSLVIIIFLLAFYKQFAHLASADPGIKRNNVPVMQVNGQDEKIAKQKVAAVAGVRNVSAMSALFDKPHGTLNFPVWLNNKQDALSMNYYYADASFIPDMGLQVVAGSNFNPVSETAAEQAVIINEQAVKAMGFKSNRQAVGQQLWISDSVKLEITGVLKDFYYENSAAPVQPFLFRNKSGMYNYLYIGIDNTSPEVITTRISNAMSSIVPPQSLEFVWLDEYLSENYSQVATISLLGYLAFMAIAIASLGLLGLVIYTVEVKRKEIGIRKIIGATNKQLIVLLSRGFVRLLFIAGLIAVPVGYTLSYIFLQNFPNRKDFGIVTAIGCFVVLLSIGLITIISQTYKAASANPAGSLRTE